MTTPTSIVGFRSSRNTPGFHEVRIDHKTIGVIMKRGEGFDVFERGSLDVIARKYTASAAKEFARTYFAKEVADA